MEFTQHREPWNKGKLVGQKRPLKPKDIWAIRIQLQNAHQVRDLAMFNLAIDSSFAARSRRASMRRHAWTPDTPSGHGDPEKNSAAGAVRAD